MFEVGLLLAFVGGGFALLMLWSGSAHPARPAHPGERYFVRCGDCLAEVRIGRLTCPRCGSAQIDAE